MSLTRLGRYEITGTLGRGAMGIVYRAHDPLIERTVAIKTVACAGLSQKEAEDFEQRFFREAKSAGQLNHPNIVTIHDVGRSDDLAYIAMEFLPGRSLRDILDSGCALSPELTVDIVAAIADGLAFAHARGIVHRDIKPANIMVTDGKAVKITDFGIALLPGGSLTMVGAVLGSPKYMSPEQVAGHKADGRSDVFSLGTVLYEMLTGKPPFTGDNPHATMYQVLNSEPPPPSSCNPQLPKRFDHIVARALAKDPAMRYQSAAEMAADLRNALRTPELPIPGDKAGKGDEEVPAAMSADNTETALPRESRQRSSLLRYGLALLALALLAGAALLLLRPPAPPPAAGVPALPAGNGTDKAPTPAPPGAKKKSPERSTPTGAPAASSKDWKAALRADLHSCEEQSLFKRIPCVERARWRHCPGHWGSIDECPSNANGQ